MSKKKATTRKSRGVRSLSAKKLGLKQARGVKGGGKNPGGGKVTSDSSFTHKIY